MRLAVIVAVLIGLTASSAAAQIGNPAALDTGEIVLGDNVWLSSRSLVLPGSHVASDAVLAVGTMCMGAAVDNFCLVAGNPAGRPLPIPRLMGMKTVS